MWMNKMTDEEKAEEYADWFWGASPSEQRAIKQAYLAGVKAGRPQWHKVADGDLPSNDRYVWTNVGACYYDEAGWWDDFGRLQDVIAWCYAPEPPELPKEIKLKEK